MNRPGHERVLRVIRERLNQQTIVDNIARLDVKRPFALEVAEVQHAATATALFAGRVYQPLEIES